jgi:molybdopterin synthase catalytic subunit
MQLLDVKVTAEPLLMSDVPWDRLRGSGHGACNVFTGTVRSRNHGREVRRVAYDAFVPLAETVMREIADAALTRAGGEGSVFIRHRIGSLPVGEISVIIVAHTPHRAEAFAVCREVIEEIKVRAPVWKQETYTDGKTGWLKGHALCSHAREGRANAE